MEWVVFSISHCIEGKPLEKRARDNIAIVDVKTMLGLHWWHISISSGRQAADYTVI